VLTPRRRQVPRTASGGHVLWGVACLARHPPPLAYTSGELRRDGSPKQGAEATRSFHVAEEACRAHHPLADRERAAFLRVGERLANTQTPPREVAGREGITTQG
jgi:hypothetical protein